MPGYQLQTAADNAALTGAYALAAPIPSRLNMKKCDEFARDMAGRNTVDGIPLIDDGGKHSYERQYRAASNDWPSVLSH